MSDQPRIVIDTNLVLSALLFNGMTATLRKAWQTEQCIPLVSQTTVLELMRVLAYPKFKLTPPEQQDLLADYIPYCETVTIPEPSPPVPECRDRFDLPFLVLAQTAQADYLITGDQDLLVLDGQIICPIIPLRQFLDDLEVS